MRYNILGENLPVVSLILERGESVQCESGAMSWMDDGFRMETTSGGGFGKVFSRMVTGESLMMNTYIAEQQGEIAFAAKYPGSIIAVEIRPDTPVIVQKSSFLAAAGDIDVSIAFQKRLGSGLFGGEGFIMERISGNGLVFLEIDGSAVTYELARGQRKIVNTGYVAIMDQTVNMDIEPVKGVKNIIFGGEGLFNTILTGPGRVTLQSMPISDVAMTLYRYMPHPNSN